MLGLPWLKQHGVDVLAILDLDEFMFGTDGKNLKQHVVKVFGVDNPPSQFSCHWTMFGSSGHDKQPPSIRKGFTWRKKDLDQNIKSVMLLKDVTGLGLHSSAVTGQAVPCPPGIQLNHYAIQSKEFFEKVKMTRGAADQIVNVRDWNYFNIYDVKDEEDTKLKDLVEAAEAAAPQ